MFQGAESTTSLALSIDSDAKLEKDGDVHNSSVQIQVAPTEDTIGKIYVMDS